MFRTISTFIPKAYWIFIPKRSKRMRTVRIIFPRGPKDTLFIYLFNYTIFIYLFIFYVDTLFITSYWNWTKKKQGDFGR